MRMVLRNWSPLFHAAAIGMGLYLLAIVLVYWLWNALGHVLGAPRAELKHSLAFVTCAIAVALVLRHRRR